MLFIFIFPYNVSFAVEADNEAQAIIALANSGKLGRLYTSEKIANDLNAGELKVTKPTVVDNPRQSCPVIQFMTQTNAELAG